MKYYVLVDETKRSRQNGMIPVAVLFKDGSKRFVVNTGLVTAEKFKGMAFPTTESNARAKTKRLMAILDDVERFVVGEGVGMAWNEAKARLRAIVGGEEFAAPEKRTLAGCIDEFAETKRNAGTQRLYRITAEKVRKYDTEATLDGVDKAWLDGFVESLGDVSVNYRWMQLKNVRAVFNWAIDNGWTRTYPFRRYRMKTERTAINNISVEVLRMVRDCRLEGRMAMYRDLFMLSFYLCGMNPSDLLMLKRGDMRNGRIRYRRMKTGRMYDIPVTEEAAAIIERYRGKDWLLCPMDSGVGRMSFECCWNRAVKRIGTPETVRDCLGRPRKKVVHPIAEGLTLYSARYTFASIGAELEIPRETIALCLGHSWADVTSRYIAYDLKRVDEAVRRIVDYVNGE